MKITDTISPVVLHSILNIICIEYAQETGKLLSQMTVMDLVNWHYCKVESHLKAESAPPHAKPIVDVFGTLAEIATIDR